MTKTAKNKEVLNQLYDLVVKQAGAPKPVATGVPGKDTAVEAVSDKHDKVNQNAVGPENLKPQHHEQKESTDPAKPAAHAKKADEVPAVETPAASAPVLEAKAAEANPSVEKLGKEILEVIQKMANNPVATGIPGKEPKSESVNAKHETVEQNAVKPEHNPQGFHQKPSTDPSKPVATAKSAEELKEEADKTASYELGKLWAEMVYKQAQEVQLTQVKEAGRRDFEALVSNAINQMKQAGQQQQVQVKAAADMSAEVEKQAEAEGAAAFHALYKQAQIEQAFAQINAQNAALQAKLAEIERAQQVKEAEYKALLAAKQAEIEKAAAEEREQVKFAQLANLLEDRIVTRMQREVAARV